MRRAFRVALIVVGVAVSAPVAGQQETFQTDSDPTRPVFASVRPEFYRIDEGVEQRALIVRYDTLASGAICRFELPFAGANVGSDAGQGIGDAYGQFFILPYTARGGFVWAVGSGVVLPTATSRLLGAGKLVVAPVTAPLWRFPRGMFIVKVQNFISVAGDASRPDVNYLLVTPLFVHAVGSEWWVLIDSETKTNWRFDARTGVKSGLQFGRRVGPNVGIWLKPEVWWGQNRDGDWNLKFGIVWYQGPGGQNRS